MGDSVAAPIQIPSLNHPDGVPGYAGSILRPADTTTYPGKRPLVVLAHGSGGNRCALFWAAQDLAGHGYVTMIWTAAGPNQDVEFTHGVDAQLSAIAFARSGANPVLSVTDGQRVAVFGYSLGSVVTAYNQQLPDAGVLAAVTLDNLHRYRLGDTGGPGDCTGAPTGEIQPRIPVLSFAKDETCDDLPASAPPDLKLPGFLHWRDAGIPVVELVMRGFVHTTFGNAGTEQAWHDLSYFIEPWLDRYLSGDGSATTNLFSETINDRPTTEVLSGSFHSAAFIPGGIDTTDYAKFLTKNAGPPKTLKVGKADTQVTINELKHGHERFRFKSDQPDSTFTCQLDEKRYAPCSSPVKIKHAKVGRHTFHVRSTDVGGLREAKPAKWNFLVAPGR